MAWAIVVLAPVLAIGQRQDYYALSMFSAFALWAAMIFERASNSLRNLGAATVGLVGIAISLIAIALPQFLPKNESEWGETDLRWTAWKALADMPASTWLHFRPLLAIAAVGLLTGAVITVYLLRRGREKGGPRRLRRRRVRRRKPFRGAPAPRERSGHRIGRERAARRRLSLSRPQAHDSHEGARRLVERRRRCGATFVLPGAEGRPSV